MAFHCAVSLLERREHSKLDLLQKLSLRDFSSTDIDTAIETIAKKYYLSDERFAACRCRYQLNRGYDWLYIANEL